MNKFRTVFLEGARDFILSLPEQARSKVVYNIHKVEGGVQSSDLFKKLEGTNIWEFRTRYNGVRIGCSLFGIRRRTPWWWRLTGL